MLVGRRMTRNPVTVTPNISIAEAMERMRSEKVRRFPVLGKDRKLVGIVAYDDLLHASPSSVTSLTMWEISYLLSRVKIDEVMSKEVITVTEETTLEEAARLMVDNKIGGLPVMRDDALVGIITESDLFKVFLELLGAREKGTRLTVLAPYFKGSLAQISTAITERGGLILALNTFLGEDTSNWGCHLKVADISKEELLEVVKPLVLEIIDVREI
jgi:acetoin utilization protein AcuB